MSCYDPDSQRLFVKDLLNCRDLGGIVTSEGKTVNSNVFIRCGSPILLSDTAYMLLKDHGVRTVIDLRSEAELEQFGNPFRDDPDVTFHNIPLFVGDPGLDEDPTMVFLQTHKLGDFYVIMLNELGHNIVKILKILEDDSNGLCLFHCAHGKDRTGVIAAILYMIAGISREDIITSYKVSYEYASFFLDPLIAKKPDNMKHTLRSDTENMVILLDYIDSRYGGDIRIYLKENGMTDEDITRLEKRLIG